MDFAPCKIAGCTRYVGDMPEFVVTRLSPGVVRRHGPAGILRDWRLEAEGQTRWLEASMVAIATLRKIKDYLLFAHRSFVRRCALAR